MKALTIALVLCLSSHAFAFPHPSEDDIKKAKQECNATIPVTRDPIQVLSEAIMKMNEVNASHNEKCFVDCFLQKINATDVNGTFYEDKLNRTKTDPESVGIYNLLASTVFVLNRSTKYIGDKCERAFVNFSQMLTQQVVLFIAKLGEELTTGKGRIYYPVKNGIGNQVDVKLEQKIKQNSNFFEHLAELSLRELLNKNRSKAQS